MILLVTVQLYLILSHPVSIIFSQMAFSLMHVTKTYLQTLEYKLVLVSLKGRVSPFCHKNQVTFSDKHNTCLNDRVLDKYDLEPHLITLETKTNCYSLLLHSHSRYHQFINYWYQQIIQSLKLYKIGLRSGINLIKLFWSKFTHAFL